VSIALQTPNTTLQTPEKTPSSKHQAQRNTKPQAQQKESLAQLAARGFGVW
jgi:hypothetical protein